MNRRSVLLAGAAMLPAHAALAQTAENSAGTAAGGSWRLKPFMLEDVNGTMVDDSVLEGRFAIVFFGYTSCPDVCPTTLLAIGQALHSLGADASKVLPLFISLDPRRDTRKVLSDYTAAIDPQIVALRGPKAYVHAIAANFGVTYAIVTPDPASPGNYSIDHTSAIFLVGPDGTMRQRFSPLISADELARGLRANLAAAP